MSIAITCLRCGHRTSGSEQQLTIFGLASDALLVTLTKRLVCKECGSRSVQTYRYGEDDVGEPSIVPRK